MTSQHSSTCSTQMKINFKRAFYIGCDFHVYYSSVYKNVNLTEIQCLARPGHFIHNKILKCFRKDSIKRNKEYVEDSLIHICYESQVHVTPNIYTQ